MTDQLGKPVRRKEDPALLSGRGRYADDLPVPVGTLHAHVIRSPHAHADIVRIDAEQALAHDAVWAVITGEDIRKLSDPFLAAVKTPAQQWTLAVERVRYVGEPSPSSSPKGATLPKTPPNL
jgi:2-furoyl-CoA dehydrogenase large subunit